MSVRALDELLDAIRKRWTERGLRLAPTLGEIDEFNRRLGVTLPAQFATYLKRVGGMVDEAVDRNLLAFWSVARIERDAPALRVRYGDLIAFADFDFEASRYLLSCRDGDLGVVYLEGVSLVPIAPSFEAFLELYLWDVGAIMPGRGGGT